MIGTTTPYESLDVINQHNIDLVSDEIIFELGWKAPYSPISTGSSPWNSSGGPTTIKTFVPNKLEQISILLSELPL